MSRALGGAAGPEELLGVINIGLSNFEDAINAAPGGRARHVEWRPPGDGDPATARILAELLDNDVVERANEIATAKFLAAQPVLATVAPAHTVIAALCTPKRTLLHAGPPISWPDMCGPMRGAILGATRAEGWADDVQEAEALIASGGIAFAPCHDSAAVGPMAGVISPSMPVWIVEDTTTGHRTFSNLNEGLGKVLRFGAHDDNVLERLKWMADELAPLLAATLGELGPVALLPLMGQALQMGDELHNRNAAATGQLLKRIAPTLVSRAPSAAVARRALEFIGSNDHFFLNVAMAAFKSMLDAACGIPSSTVVTTMARNGVNFGVRLSGTGDRWFEAPAQIVNGLYFSGYGPADAAADLGDSAIAETAGLGGFAMAAAPAIVQFVGGTAADALSHTRRMATITRARHGAFAIPALGFESAPSLIDARLVVDTGLAPVINTGIAHREAGVGQIGAGVTEAPLACFSAALHAIATANPLGRASP